MVPIPGKQDSGPQFDADLIRRYDQAGPRYTSYPTAAQFHTGFGEAQYRECVRQSNDAAGFAPLSLYFHIPFCSTVCYYCACNKIITKNRAHARRYLDRLYREIEAQASLFKDGRPVEQLHWGGGTPTYLEHQQMAELMRITRDNFTLLDDGQGEYSIEIDPRSTTPDTIGFLGDLGFNRLSIGVQDFDPAVQRAVNRVQSEEETLAAINAAREAGFKSVNLDLIYGLPFQTRDSFAITLDRIIEADADRLSVFNYAHLPGLFKTQRQIDESALPSPAEKLAILQTTIEMLSQAGYVYIGMDHFARPDDELAVAQREHKLYRNFQGYSTHAECDLLALGITGISRIGNCYSQNVKTLDDYYQRIDSGRLPVYRGVDLNDDDLLRYDIISALICHFSADYAPIEARYGIVFADYFDRRRPRNWRSCRQR